MAFHDLANQDDHRDVNGLNSETRFQVFSFEKQVSVVDECQTFPHLAGSELSGDEFGFFEPPRRRQSSTIDQNLFEICNVEKETQVKTALESSETLVHSAIEDGCRSVQASF